jgi:hypothetical protein
MRLLHADERRLANQLPAMAHAPGNFHDHAVVRNLDLLAITCGNIRACPLNRLRQGYRIANSWTDQLHVAFGVIAVEIGRDSLRVDAHLEEHPGIGGVAEDEIEFPLAGRVAPRSARLPLLACSHPG